MNLQAVIPSVVAPAPSGAGESALKSAVLDVRASLDALGARQEALEAAAGLKPHAPSGLDVMAGYLGVFFVAFVVTILVVPLIRRLAIANDIIDRPDQHRKVHRLPVAYLGGVAVYLGMLAAIGFAYFAPLHRLIDFHSTRFLDADSALPFSLPMSIVFGMTIVMLVGFWDDVAKIAPMQKVGGQLVAAAALAISGIGTNVAKQVLSPIGALVGNADLSWTIHVAGMDVPLNLTQWVGVVIIAVFVLGACNASNLIDGLDGLLSGVTAIAGMGLLFIAVWMAQGDTGPLDASRIVLCMALIGACLGYLPHNWNPASIFLGDAGSLLLGYTTIVIVLTLGNEGATNLVIAGLVIYSIPIIDTTLAIVRRKMAGQSISSADANHLHHILKRGLGVKGAVLSLYGMGALFAVFGAAMIYGRSRVTYALFMVLAGFIAVIAIKAARRHQLEEQAKRLAATPASPPMPEPGGHAPPAPAAPTAPVA